MKIAAVHQIQDETELVRRLEGVCHAHYKWTIHLKSNRYRLEYLDCRRVIHFIRRFQKRFKDLWIKYEILLSTIIDDFLYPSVSCFFFFFFFSFSSSKNCAFLFRELYSYCSYVADLLKRMVRLYIVSMYHRFKKKKAIEGKSFSIDL